ncbi:MAG: NosD domain-containing protein [Nakamurella sp.]
MRIRTLLIIPVAMVLAMTGLPAAASAAGPVAASCGAVLTTNAVLTADLSCTGDGITLTGDVSLDLRGHTLSGTGSDRTAVTVISGSSPKISNGVIEKWNTGIAYDNPEGDPDLIGTTSVNSVRFRTNSVAISASGGLSFSNAPGYVIKSSRFEENFNGIQGVFTGSVKVSGSTFRKNQSAIGIDTGSLEVTGSRFDDNGVGVSCTEASCTVRGNYLTSNSTALASRTFGMTASHNLLSRNDIGFDAFVSLGNNLSYNAFVSNTTGVHLSTGGGTISRNSFTGNQTGFASEGGQDPFTATLDNNIFTRNGSGIFIEDEGISLRKNTARNNTGWGIYAPHSIDLGGNQASGNGNSPQCVGVVC